MGEQRDVREGGLPAKMNRRVRHWKMSRPVAIVICRYMHTSRYFRAWQLSLSHTLAAVMGEVDGTLFSTVLNAALHSSSFW